jgi:hypothetical protein
MKQPPIFLLLAVLIASVAALGHSTKSAVAGSTAQELQQPPAPRVIDPKASDGRCLASYECVHRRLLLIQRRNLR